MVVVDDGRIEVVDLVAGERRDLASVPSTEVVTVEQAGSFLVVSGTFGSEAVPLVDGSSSVIDGDGVFPWPGRGSLVWVVDESSDIDGRTAVSVIDLAAPDEPPLGPVRLDRGLAVEGATTAGLVVSSPAGPFLVDLDGSRSLGQGVVRGLADDHMIVWSCDAELECGSSIVDLDTGSRTGLAFDLGPSDRFQLSQLSPDGQWLAVYLFSNDGPVGFRVIAVESSEGHSAFVAGMSPFPLAWSPDGERLLWTVEGELVVHDPDGPETQFTGVELPVGSDVSLLVLDQ